MTGKDNDKMHTIQAIQISSEGAAKRIADGADIPISIISITCPKDDLVQFSRNPNIREIFRMQFNDIDHDRSSSVAPPTQRDFDGLKDFVDRQKCELLLVHCGAGVSRSAAVGAAINEYLELGQKIWEQRQYEPNRLVYRYACIELGIQPAKDEDYFRSIFAWNEEDEDMQEK